MHPPAKQLMPTQTSLNRLPLAAEDAGNVPWPQEVPGCISCAALYPGSHLDLSVICKLHRYGDTLITYQSTSHTSLIAHWRFDFSVKPLPLSPLELQSSAVIGLAGEHQALELRLRETEERKHDQRREFSPMPRVSTHSSHHSNGRHGNQLHTHFTEEGTGDIEAKKRIAPGNSSDCVRQHVVNKCEVCMTSHDQYFTHFTKSKLPLQAVSSVMNYQCLTELNTLATIQQCARIYLAHPSNCLETC